MVTMLDCIKRTPVKLRDILDSWEVLSKGSFDKMNADIGEIDQIIFVGSGTSNTAAITSKIFVEKASGIQCRNITPNELLHSTYVYPEQALYVFTSQTGTSIVSRAAQRFVRERGLLSLSITESDQTPMAKESAIHLVMGCGYEEHPMRTTGYSCSVLVHMLLGMELGLRRAYISQEQYEQFFKDAYRAAENQMYIIEETMNWMNKAKHWMLRSECIIFTGADQLYGVSLEGAMKVWETPQIPCFGYEIEEGIHGPNYGYNSRHCIIVLNNGGREEKKMMSLARYMKEVHGSGLMAGVDIVDSDDLKLKIKSSDFYALEFAPVVQCIAYHLALDFGRDMSLPHDNSKMDQYFVTHLEKL